MTKMIPTSDLIRDRNYDLADSGHEQLSGMRAYGQNGEHIGTVKDALTQEGGSVRYFLVEVGNWFSNKTVAIPVGLGRIEDDGVYFDSLTKDQAKGMNEYREGQDYGYDNQVADARVLRGVDYVAPTADRAEDHYQDETMFKAPQKLQLLEERLNVNKEKYQAGSVQVGKKVETRTENVNVDLARDEVVISRTPLSEPRPVAGNVTLGDSSQSINVNLEAERANVTKQAFVTEEVEIGKRTVQDQRTFSETVGKEVLDVTKSGDVQMAGEGQVAGDTDEK